MNPCWRCRTQPAILCHRPFGRFRARFCLDCMYSLGLVPIDVCPPHRPVAADPPKSLVTARRSPQCGDRSARGARSTPTP